MTFEDKYSIDAVTLSKMTEQQSRSSFVHDNCRIPAEILYEARWYETTKNMLSLEYPVTIQVLNAVHDICSGIKKSDTLLDLYKDEGNGDVVILAVAVTENKAEQCQLFYARWTIATDDKGVSRKASELGIPVLDSLSFFALIT